MCCFEGKWSKKNFYGHFDYFCVLSIFSGDVKQVEKEIKKIFIEAFKKTDEDFLKEAARK